MSSSTAGNKCNPQIMSKIKYCDEGQAEASILVNGITYKTNNPPLFVEVQSYTKNLTQWFLTVTNYSNEILSSQPIAGTIYDSSLGQDINVSADAEPLAGAWNVYIYRFLYGSFVSQSVIVIPFPLGWYEGTIITEFARQSTQVQVNQIVATDKDNTIILTSPILPYTINCDGCGVGECKGRKASYPGYDCLDCLGMQRQLRAIGRRIDGITKRRRN